MSHVDQFESAFRAAIKPTYEPHAIAIKRAALVHDIPEKETAELEGRLKRYLNSLHCPQDGITWHHFANDSFATSTALLEEVRSANVDLICTYRNLGTQDWKARNSLGSRLDTLIYRTAVPVLIIPHPHSEQATAHELPANHVVTAITDHLTNDHTLIDYAQTFTEPKGTLALVHIEDQQVFDRYLDAISKVTTIDTEQAREALREQLLAEPHKYVASCRERLTQADADLKVSEIIEFGAGITPFQQHINALKSNLLVLRALDEDSPGIHGLAQSLAREIREIPVLML